MSDNISRQAAIDEIQPFGEYESNMTNKEWVRRFTFILEQLPSKDHNGEWLEAPCEDKHDKFVLCSECRTFGGSGELAEVVKNYNFCPHCGADMRGEGDGR